MTTLCFGIDSSSSDEYLFYKKIFHFLHLNPSFKVFFSFKGEQLEFFKKEHSETLRIMHEAYSKGQIEVLANGYYEPIFPLLFPRERTIQIEKLSLLTRQSLGIRTRGIYPKLSAWDFSLVQSFLSAGLEYVLLDKCVISTSLDLHENQNLPYLMSDKGKSIAILPITKRLFSQENLLQYANTLLEADKDSLAITMINPQDLEKLIDAGTMSTFCNTIYSNPNKTAICTPYELLKKQPSRQNIYIATGSELGEIHKYLQQNPPSLLLYNRTLYQSLLLNQIGLDKSTKDNAREFLLEAQNGRSFTGDFFQRQQAYKALSSSEKILRTHDFKEGLTKFDYDADGINEYIARAKDYFCVIKQRIAGIIDFENIQRPTGNYLDDGFLFKDAIDNDFIDTYNETKFAFLQRRILFTTKTHSLFIKKKITASSSSITVQYIIKSSEETHFRLAISHKICNISKEPYEVKIISDNEVIKSTTAILQNATQVRCIQITDTAIATIFEPNEPCNISITPASNILGSPFILNMEWNIELHTGGETEKTITFCTLKKRD